MTLEDLRSKYRPREGYRVYSYQSDITGNYVAYVIQAITINKYRKEDAEVHKELIVEKDIDNYFKKLKPYLHERTN